MGAAGSITSDHVPIQEIYLKKLPEAVEECVYVDEKFPLILDPTEQASRFLKYQSGAFVNFNDPLYTANEIGKENRIKAHNPK